MTKTELITYINTYIENSAVEAFTNLRLQTALLEIVNDAYNSSITDAANTTALQALSGANYTYVIVTGVGFFKYSSTGTANGTTIFAAAGGGVWQQVFAGGSGAADVTAPTVTSATAINSTTIRIVFNEVVTATNIGWSFKKNGSAHTPTSVSGSGTNTLDFTVPTMINTDTILRSYNSATGDTVDAATNELVTFTDASVTNSIVAAPTGAILIFQWGQSNAVGRADADAPNEVTVPAGVYEYKPSTNSIVALTDPTGEGLAAATSRSLNPNLGKRLKELTGQDVIILPAGKGNTPIASFISTGSAFYTDSLADWNALKSYCTSNGVTINGAYAHFLQGENDAGTLETDGYLDNLNTMIDLFDTDFAVDKSFVTRIGYDPSFTSAANSEKIMKAQNLLDLSKDQMLLTSKAASTFTTGNGKMKADGVHYTVTGYNEIGEDIAEAINQLRTNNKKVAHTTEPVTALQDAVGYFDDIYNFRSLKVGSNATLEELYGRNNLTLSSGSPTFDGVNGLNVTGSLILAPASLRSLTNAFDWSIELTLKFTGTPDCIVMVGTTPSWVNNYVYFSGATLYIQGNGVTKSVSLVGYNLNQKINIAIVYSSATNNLRVYANSNLVNSSTDWAFTQLNLTRYLYGYLSGSSPFVGTIERMRIVKRALAVWEFDRSPNIGTAPAFDYDFQFTSSIAEAQGDITTTFHNFDGTSATPAYDADGLIFTEGTYLRLSTQKVLNDATFEYRLKHDATLADGLEFITGRNSTPNSGGFEGMIVHDVPNNRIYFGVEGSGTYVQWTGLSVTWTSLNTYKFVRNYAANTVELFINGVSQTSKSLTGQFFLNIIGAGHPTQAYSFKGTIDYFKVKNSI